MSARAVLTDIEGTTSAIHFVRDVLFPYAARAIPAFLQRQADTPTVSSILDDVARQADLPREDLDALTHQLLTWIAEDRKITPLKTLQGLVWQEGYERGAYRAHVYADAVAVLSRWHRKGVPLYVYSSGSIAAQQLFFRHSEAGDLTPLFRDYFDTTIGNKREPQSYRNISDAIGRPPSDILFLSDLEAELDAAAAAGMQTCWLQRPEEATPAETGSRHPVARDFEEIPVAVDP